MTEAMEMIASDHRAHRKVEKIELYNDHFQNYKRYAIPKAQLVIADIPYNLGNNAYASNPTWYVGGDDSNGQSKLAGKEFFDTDIDFRIPEYFHFCQHMLIKEPKETGKAPCMIIFCAFQQLQMVMDEAKKSGFKGCIPLVFIKNYSAQVLKANMKIVGATEYGLVIYRDKLPKFNNGGKMIYNWFNVSKDMTVPKIHPTQKSVPLLKELIAIFTDPGDVVIDPVAGSGTTLRACAELHRSCYGFEIKKNFYNDAKSIMLSNVNCTLELGI